MIYKHVSFLYRVIRQEDDDVFSAGIFPKSPQPSSSSLLTQPPPKRRRVEVTRNWRLVDIPEKAVKVHCEPDFLENLQNPILSFELFIMKRCLNYCD